MVFPHSSRKHHRDESTARSLIMATERRYQNYTVLFDDGGGDGVKR